MQKKSRNVLLVGAALLCVIVAFYIIRHPAVKTMDMAEAQSRMGSEYVYLLDARPVQLYMESHIPGAIWYPEKAIYEIGIYMMYDYNRPVWVYGEDVEQAKTRALQLKEKAYADVTVIGSFEDYTGPVEGVNPPEVWNSPTVALFLQNRYDDIYHYLDPKYDQVTLYSKKPVRQEVSPEYQLAMYHYVEEYRKNGKNPDVNGGHVMAMYRLHEGLYEGLEGRPVQGSVADKLEAYYTIAFDRYVEQMEKMARENIPYRYASSIPEDYKNVGQYVHYCNALWKQKNGSGSQGNSGNKGGSSSGNKAHGFVGSDDEWEDYDDYMDDYEYWEHRDVDDEDDWEDDWDEEE